MARATHRLRLINKIIAAIVPATIAKKCTLMSTEDKNRSDMPEANTMTASTRANPKPGNRPPRTFFGLGAVVLD